MAEHRRYTKRQKAEAVTVALGSSTTAASDGLDIPRKTIAYWMDAPEFADLRRKTRDQIAEGSMVLANLAQSELQRKVKAGEVEPRDLAIIYGIAIDKAQLLAGHATERYEHRELDEFSDHESRAIVEGARRYLAGTRPTESQALAEGAAVEGAGA